MPSYLHPGVYIEEIPSGSKPIEGVGTSTAAFVGKAVRGPVSEAVLIQSFSDYTKTYGDIGSVDDNMGLAVQAFYLNGGKSAYIGRLVGKGSDTATLSVIGQDSAPNSVLDIAASSPGEWGNSLFVKIEKPDIDALTFNLEVGFRLNDEFESQEQFIGLSMREADSNFALKVVNDTSSLVTLSLGVAADPENASEHYVTAEVTGAEVSNSTDFSAELSGSDPKTSLALNINGLGTRVVTLNPPAFETPLTGTFADDAVSVAFEIAKAVQSLGLNDAFQLFGCEFDTDHFVFSFPEPSVNADKPNSSLIVVDGPLSSLLGVSREQKTILFSSGTGFSGNTFFESNINGEVTLIMDIDNHGDIELKINADDLDFVADNKTDGETLALAIENAVRAFNPSVKSFKDFECEYNFAITVSNRKFQLTSGSQDSPNPGLSVNPVGIGTTLQLDPGDLTVGRRVRQATYRVLPLHDLGALEKGTVLLAGSENDATAADFSLFYQNILRKVRDVSILLNPGQSWAEDGSGNSIISASLAHCEKMKSRMLIVDPPQGLELDQAALVESLALPSSTYTSLYYPWVQVANPFYNAETNPMAPKTLDVAPSAFAAGLWAKTDGKRGVWKAPAGMGVGLIGAAGLQYIVEDGEQDQLNPLGINCYRNMPGGGRVVWGARTLATKADPEWRYVPVRRTAIMIEQSIYGGIQWAVFEPNDHRLWSALRANVGNFMNGLFRVGAFQGEKASDAYFVRCGLGDTMTQGEIDAGQVIVIVGFAPLKPAEFVIVRIQQKVNQQ